MSELGRIAARAVVIYLVVLVTIRVSGKRTVGNFTAFDLLVAMLVGDVVDEAIYGDVTLAQGVTAIGSLMLLHIVNAFLGSRSAFIERLTGGTPVVLIRNGRIDRRALRRELMHESELMTALRMEQIERVEDVQQAVLECSGEVSVLPVPRRSPRPESRGYHGSSGAGLPRAGSDP